MMKSGEHELWDAHVVTAESRASWAMMFRVAVKGMRAVEASLRKMRAALEQANENTRAAQARAREEQR